MQDDESAVSHTRLAYLPALDGVRACAVVAVMMFHGGIPHMDGGFMGVDAFFVLSGFLITSLLVGEWRQTLTIKLGAFWARRARRLLPALLLMLLFVAFFASVIVPKGTYGALRLDALSTLLYVSNWHFILVNSNYFNETAASSPLLHTWSLAVEEQFYVIWPLVVLGVMHFTKSLRALFALCCAAALASATWMYVLYDGGLNTNRAYLGTDTRSQCLFIGCALAVGLVLLARRSHEEGRLAKGELWQPAGATGTLLCGVVGLVGALAAVALWVLTTSTSSFPYTGGFFLIGLAVGGVILSAVAAPRSIVPRVLSLTPVRYVGRISYGLYIWHWPIFIWLDHARTGLAGYELFAVRVLVTFGVSVVSFHLVERPIRMGTFVSTWRAWLVVPAGVGAVLVAVIAATTGTTAVASTALPGPVNPPASTTTTTQPGEPVTGAPVRVLLFGDSVALTLGIGLSFPPDQNRYGYVLSDKGILGCGVVNGPEVQLLGVPRHHAPRLRRVTAPAGRAGGQEAVALPVAGRHERGQAERGRAPGGALGGGRPGVPGHVDQHIAPGLRRLREGAARGGVAARDDHGRTHGVPDRAVHQRGGTARRGAVARGRPGAAGRVQPAGPRGRRRAPADRLGRRPQRGGLPRREVRQHRRRGRPAAQRRHPLHQRRGHLAGAQADARHRGGRQGAGGGLSRRVTPASGSRSAAWCRSRASAG